MGAFRHPISHGQVLVRRLLKAVFKVVRCFSCKGRQDASAARDVKCFSCKGRQDVSAARDATGGAASSVPSVGPCHPGLASLACKETSPVPSPPSNMSPSPLTPPPSSPLSSV